MLDVQWHVHIYMLKMQLFYARKDRYDSCDPREDKYNESWM